MLVKAARQTKREFCIAVLNRELHKNSRCPGNYSVDYAHGWFTSQYGSHEPIKMQRPDLTAEADRIMRDGMQQVGYQSGWNTFVLMQREGDAK